jgi:succinoglycan biosynthesis protein ExoA
MDLAPTCLLVIPTLNEARHIGPLLERIIAQARTLGARIVVADGGSTDGTQDIVRGKARDYEGVSLIHNPHRIQSGAINLAVAWCGEGVDYFIRIDAHGDYPADYCAALLAEAIETGADSIVVPMITTGQESLFQRAVAAAQNSLVGNGGSAHRSNVAGRWVEHGHHALMRVAAFEAVGGYDEGFSTNEDAELDFRLGAAGSRIWLSGRTRMVYYPRASATGLFRQYFGYGGGRARNILKHRVIPRLRQLVPLAVAPAVVLAGLSFFYWPALVPLVLWLAASMALGAMTIARQAGRYRLPPTSAPLVGAAAMIMHLAWSAGFWLELAGSLGRRRPS